MKNISLKQWIIAGIKSGIIVGILISVLSFIEGPKAEFFLWIVMPCLFFFVYYIFIGSIVGIILFFIYDKIPCKNKLLKCLIVPILIAILIILFRKNYLLEYYSFLLLLFYTLRPIFDSIILGFLIYHFINKTNQKIVGKDDENLTETQSVDYSE